MAMIRMEQVHGMNAIPTSRLKGGYQMVRLKKNLEAIGDDNRVEGMRVYCLEDKTVYILVDDGNGNLVFKPSSEVEEVSDSDVRTLFDVTEKTDKDPKNTPPEPSMKPEHGITGAVYWDDVQDKPDVFTPAMHNHDDRYIKISDAAIQSPYDIAVKNGYEGTESEWLKSLKGTTPTVKVGKVKEGDTADVVNSGTRTNVVLDFTLPVREVKGLQGEPGKSAYEVAVENGFKGTETEWVYSMVGHDGKSAYQVAVGQGFQGSVQAWLESLVGKQGAQGAKGDPGKDGEKGDAGSAATIAVGKVTTGETASVTNSGTPSAAILDFVFPEAEKLKRTVLDFTITPDQWSGDAYAVENEDIKENSMVVVRTPQDASETEFKDAMTANIQFKYEGAGKGKLIALAAAPKSNIKIQLVIMDAAPYYVPEVKWSDIKDAPDLSKVPQAEPFKPTKLAITLKASEWKDGKYTIDDVSIKADSTAVIGLPAGTDLEVYKAFSNACIAEESQKDGQVVLKAMQTVPTNDINIKLVLL